MAQDRIYSVPLKQVGSFVFDDKVVEVFPDMIARSVPGYASIVGMTIELSKEYVRPDSNVYDLGCSLGAVALPVAGAMPTNCNLVAVDSSQAMIERLSSEVATGDLGTQIDLRLEDIRDTEIRNASFVVLNYTLQFVPLEDRGPLLERIWSGMREGGALVLSEKVFVDDSESQELLTTLHHSFKRANGYSDLEIAQKRTSLENTLVPETVETHLTRMQEAGFGTAAVWFQCLNFASFLAVK
ncbi:MAG: carboxy-S-adenosyl-L-methionine synthase CmoA [Planctomycetota bacterium]